MAFENCFALKEIILPDSLNYIGSYSFKACSSAQSLYLGNNLNKISIGAFGYCYSILAIVVPRSVEIFMDSVFVRCVNLKYISFEEGCQIREFHPYTFSECMSLEEFIFPRYVVEIGHSCFEFCYKLERIVFNNLLEIITPEAFYNCTSLLNFEIPEDNHYFSTFNNDGILYDKGIISLKHFPKGKMIETYIIPDTIRYICSYALSYCINIKLILFNNNLLEIRTHSFEGCIGLTIVYLPNSLKLIAVRAFKNCINLNKIFLGKNIKAIEKFAFDFCHRLSCVYYFGTKKIVLSPYSFINSGVNVIITTTKFRYLTMGNLPVFKANEPIGECPPISLYTND